MNKLQFSKGIILFSGILFFITLLHCFFNAGLDTTVMMTELTVVGSVFLSSCVWYYKKACQENTASMRLTHAKDMAELEYVYFEKRARLKKELELTDMDMSQLKEDSQLDELRDEAVSDDSNYLRDKFKENSTDPETESVG